MSLLEYSSINDLVLVLIDEKDRVVLYIPVMKDVDSYYIVLTIPGYGQHALAIVTAILKTVLIVGLVLILYMRWQAVAEAGALVMAGRIEEPAVLTETTSLCQVISIFKLFLGEPNKTLVFCHSSATIFSIPF